MFRDWYVAGGMPMWHATWVSSVIYRSTDNQRHAPGADYKPSSEIETSRISTFRILPVTVIGNVSTIFT